jgi:hypothetical protein
MILSRGRPISSASLGRQQRRLDDRLAHHLLGRQRRTRGLVLVHQARQQFLVERAPVDADAHRLVVADRHLDDRGELLVLLVLEADIARVDAVFRQRLGAGRMVGEQLVADIVEVADQRHVTPSRSSRSRIFGTAAALSSRSTVMRTISEPARCSAATCATVASISAVSVLVIDCTTTGAPPPTITPPTSTPTECRDREACRERFRTESRWCRSTVDQRRHRPPVRPEAGRAGILKARRLRAPPS